MKSWKAVFRIEANSIENMARPKKKMALTKMDGQVAARKRFKITFGKALQNAPGRFPPAAPQPKAANRPPVLKKPVPTKPLPSLPVPSAAQEDYLAKAVG